MTQNSKRRAVFLDRDGTVADEVGYINHVSRFRLYPWSAEAIRKINAAGLAAVVVTNQAGVGMAGLTGADLRFNIAKLAPGSNGAPSAWQNYINTAVADVNASGRVTGRAAGTVVITATSDGRSA